MRGWRPTRVGFVDGIISGVVLAVGFAVWQAIDPDAGPSLAQVATGALLFMAAAIPVSFVRGRPSKSAAAPTVPEPFVAHETTMAGIRFRSGNYERMYDRLHLHLLCAEHAAELTYQGGKSIRCPVGPHQIPVGSPEKFQQLVWDAEAIVKGQLRSSGQL